ncbi:hypothetical protein [Kibdelosporangium phytohabitans]|uniref:hypothetical protein n=1 Tax=Kibdelosporangium phytohabitans TaxID=860235 RepID=UPI001A0C0401|nr:transposase [Kibdelosporangium phytohabitans]
MDSSIMRGHQHSAGARRVTGHTQGASGSCAGQTAPDDHAIGRSLGGVTTKIHLARDGHDRPLSVLLTGGQAGDTTATPQPGTRPTTRVRPKIYKRRNVIERCFDRLKQYRTIATRYNPPPCATKPLSTGPHPSSGFEDRR